jgi:hypothetical protein
MKNILLISFLVYLAAGCKPSATVSETTVDEKEDSIRKPYFDTLTLLQTHKEILALLKSESYDKLAGYIHPQKGIRFSAYAYIDTTNDQRFTPEAFREMLKTGKELDWGSFDGSGEPIKLTWGNYTREFIYNADFLNAEKTEVDGFIGFGNSLNNLREVYPENHFVESYFSGFAPELEGMDWCCLRLVYEPYDGKLKLIAVVHDQWTI